MHASLIGRRITVLARPSLRERRVQPASHRPPLPVASFGELCSPPRTGTTSITPHAPSSAPSPSSSLDFAPSFDDQLTYGSAGAAKGIELPQEGNDASDDI